MASTASTTACVHRNLLASYAHLRSVAGNDWPARFVDFVRERSTLRVVGATTARPVLEHGHGLLNDADELDTTPTIQPAVRRLRVGAREVETDSEGYLRYLDDWSEDFVRAQAQAEGLELTDEHWQLIRFLREYYAEHGVQAQVRAMIRHFAQVWGPERGNNHVPARNLSARRAAEAGQPPGRAVAHQGRALNQEMADVHFDPALRRSRSTRPLRPAPRRTWRCALPRVRQPMARSSTAWASTTPRTKTCG